VSPAERRRAYVARVVAAVPPLTDAQRVALRVLLSQNAGKPWERGAVTAPVQGDVVPGGESAESPPWWLRAVQGGDVHARLHRYRGWVEAGHFPDLRAAVQ
jgi:hypothetical protein